MLNRSPAICKASTLPFPSTPVVGVNDPTAEQINPLRPCLYVQQLKPAKRLGDGFVTGEMQRVVLPEINLEKAPERVSLLRMLQNRKLNVSVDGFNPRPLGGPEATGYGVGVSYLIPTFPTLRRPDFTAFLKARGSITLTRLMKTVGRNGVANLGVSTIGRLRLTV